MQLLRRKIILDFVDNCTWTSKPITVSHSILHYNPHYLINRSLVNLLRFDANLLLVDIDALHLIICASAK